MKIQFCLFFIVLACLTFTIDCQAQSAYFITGTVKDETGIALPGANVFLSGTKTVTSTDQNGNFKLTVISGTYQLIVSMIGYELYTKQVDVTGQNVQLLVQINPKSTQLTEVVIRPDKEWFKNLQIFKQQFLGESANARHCKIVNAEIMNFMYDAQKNILSAEAKDPLIIMNRALGYKLTYFLKRFVYNKKNNTLNYEGYPSFSEILAVKDRDASWLNNRNKTYGGSLQHLISSLFDNNLAAQGFVLLKTKNWSAVQRASTKEIEIDPRPLVATELLDKAQNSKTLYSSDPIYIIYTRNEEPEDYTSRKYSLTNLSTDGNLPKGQVSVITIKAPVKIDKMGSYTDNRNLFTEGYLGWVRIADLMPYGYEIPDGKN